MSQPRNADREREIDWSTIDWVPRGFDELEARKARRHWLVAWWALRFAGHDPNPYVLVPYASYALPYEVVFYRND